MDETKREELLRRLAGDEEECLFLDTPTFLENNVLKLEKGLIPPIVERVSFRNSNSEVQAIEDSFLKENSSLTSLDLSGLHSLTSIGDEFLYECSITSLDLSSLSNVTKIGDLFLTGCSSITVLHLPGLNSVTRMGISFLSFCDSITSLDLSGMNSVTEIGDEFLHECSSITGVTKLGQRASSWCCLDAPCV